MDERRTLTVLGWTLAALLGFIFVLNAVALSLVAKEPEATAVKASAAGAAGPARAPIRPRG